MEQTRENSAKSVILPHKHRINNVPGRKDSFSQHTVGPFFHELIANPRTQTLVGLQCDTNTFGEKCEEKRRKIKTKITAQERKIYAVFLQVTMHLSCLSDGWVSERMSTLSLVPKLIYCFLGLVQLQSREHP